MGVSTPEENQARSAISKGNYMDLVVIEVDTLIYIARRHIIPHAYGYLKTISGDHKRSILERDVQKVKDQLEKVITTIDALQISAKKKESDLEGCQQLRMQMMSASEVVNELISLIPNNERFPDLSQFLDL